MSDIAQRGDQVQTGAGPARAAGKRQRQLLRWAGAGALAGLAWCVALPAAASGAYPSKPVTLIVPYTAGGSTDLVARIVAQKLTERLGQAFIVDNKPGANAVIGMDAAARATPDGYTLLIGNMGPIAINPTLYPETTADPLKVFAPIMQLVSGPLVLLVHPDFQRRGVGQRMMACMLERYADFHQQMLTADGDAVLFYERLGFARAGATVPMWIYAGTEH